MKRIAFLVQLPKKVSPGQRFRIEQFEPFLAQEGYHFDTFPFLNDATYKILYKKGFLLRKSWGVLVGFIKRFFFLFETYRYDYVFLQREASPVGPPIFEWLLTKVLRKKLILDFDDAIWIPDTSGNGKFARFIKCYWKVKWICKWSYKISVGNQYLERFARQYNEKVVLIPTCVDTENKFNKIKDQRSGKVVIGWTGSHSTLPYLDLIYPIIKSLENEYDFIFQVICSQPPDFHLRSLHFVPWREATEINDLLEINIGVMPLVQDAWSEGKCGFKLIQYLALGIPAVASPVGVNCRIIEDGVNGYLCAAEDEWKAALVFLIKEEQQRLNLGAAGRQKIIDYYSIQAHAGSFLKLFT